MLKKLELLENQIGEAIRNGKTKKFYQLKEEYENLSIEYNKSMNVYWNYL